jgi:hypothetical protein
MTHINFKPSEMITQNHTTESDDDKSVSTFLKSKSEASKPKEINHRKRKFNTDEEGY